MVLMHDPQEDTALRPHGVAMVFALWRARPFQAIAVQSLRREKADFHFPAFEATDPELHTRTSRASWL